MRLGLGRIGAGALLLMVAAGPVFAQPASPPLPPPRPDRPAVKPAEPTGDAVKDSGKRADDAKPTDAAPPDKEQLAEDAACRDRLTALGIKFETRPPVRDEACSVRNPVMVSQLPGGIALSPASLMTCPLAEALARWTGDSVKAQADKAFQTSVTKLAIGTSYQCRNQTSGSKLSEHAFGNGVDIMGFEFAKRKALTVDFQKIDSPEAAFQESVRSEACKVFTTVLGPGSDEAHGNHLHLDLRERKGDYRICQ
ncbi:extensin-like domain-containing protein [Microvirga pudoricolor]|uniref:extensin-like domain-containing protein n=1 Tax=Microvirga pudoricolor TaxID=2778729 RepID=UPI00194E8DA9|nr:extensin family protein [Microvirga pudoricolor]MBM6596448.1 extensin family protein [Microvirga pudoricolor]